MSWLLQSPPGLAQTLKREMVYRGCLERKQDLFIKRQRNHDLLFANKLKSDEGLPLLRIAEAVYRCPIFGRYKISKRQLETLSEALRPLGPKRLVVQVAGRNFDRRDLSRWLEKELASRDYLFSNDVEEEVWMFCIDESYYFGIPITKSFSAEGRDERELERQGSLPAPIAAALAFSGQAKNDDVIYDPVCGSGTLLSEAFAYAPESLRVGRDIDSRAASIAKVNLRNGANRIEIFQGDSRQPLNRQDVSLMLANFPFGVQFGDKKENPELYFQILQATLKSAIPHPGNFRAIVLSSDEASMRAAISRLPELESKDLFRVKIRGEIALALMLKRRV